MTHTPFASSRLAEAARLREQARELSKGWADRLYGYYGQEYTDGNSELLAQARAIEASILIPFKPLPAVDINDCISAFRFHERQRIRASLPPRLVAALVDIERMGTRDYSCSLDPHPKFQGLH